MTTTFAFGRRALPAALLFATLSTAFAQEPESAPDTQITGYFDLYYQWDFGRPDTIPGTNPPLELNGRQFDIRHNRIRLALGQLDIVRAPKEGKPFGYTFTLLAGPSADIIHGLEPAGLDSWRNFGQAFVSYRFGGATPVTLDFGKFFTPIGYEAVDNRINDTYSRGFNYFVSQPLYHTGFRATAPVTPKLTLTGGVVQGWNEVEDSNNSKSVFLGGTYAASDKLSATLTGYFGREGTDTGPISGIGFVGASGDTTLVDAILTYQADPTLKLALNADYGSTKGIGKWNGVALYAKKTLNDRSALGLRLEHVEDLDGVRTGLPIVLHSATASYDYTVTKNWSFRVEARADFASTEAFNSASGLKKNRATLTLGQIIRF